MFDSIWMVVQIRQVVNTRHQSSRCNMVSLNLLLLYMSLLDHLNDRYANVYIFFLKMQFKSIR